MARKKKIDEKSITYFTYLKAKTNNRRNSKFWTKLQSHLGPLLYYFTYFTTIILYPCRLTNNTRFFHFRDSLHLTLIV